MGIEVNLDLLQSLTDVSGVPGYEDRIREIVRDELAESTDRVETDTMGNVVGTIEGSGEQSVLVAAHMDEIGFMVSEIDDDGFLKLDPLGGWDPRVLKAKRVTVHTEDGDQVGVIGSSPPHTLKESDLEEKPDIDDVYVDIGLDEEAATEQVSPGDLVTLEQNTVKMGDLITGKAFDDRICLYSVLEAARQIEEPPSTIHFAATVQEEVGLRGARALGVDIDPDIAIALDVTIADDVPEGGNSRAPITELGDGTAIKLKDSSVITSPKVNRRLRDLAEEHDIEHQIEILPAGGTDTAAFQVVAGATPVGAISIPTRYLHTPVEAAHLEDVAETTELLVRFLESEDGSHDYRL